MLTISLDEQGDFEGKRCSEPIFIAGIIYNDHDLPYEMEDEKKRLMQYYQEVCKKVECKYPEDLHYRTYEQGGNNGSKVSKVKEEVKNSLGDFLKRGIYNGKEILSQADNVRSVRKGKYYIFVLLKSTSGKNSILGNNVSNLASDQLAGNLYVHMVEDIITRLIFHNPVIEKIDKVHMDLATRVAVLTDGIDIRKKRDDFYTLGYTRHRNDRNAFYQTNADIYRTAIEREMMLTENNTIKIDKMQVRSISYEKDVTGQEFLYLADSICSLLGYKIPGENTKEWMNEIYQRCCNLASEERSLVFSYDSIDEYFAKAGRALENQDYYTVLDKLYDANQLDSEMKAYYQKKWLPFIEEKLNQEQDSMAFEMAINILNTALRSNNVEQNRVVYIYEKLEEACSGKNMIRKSILYHLYDCGISVYTHIGDSEKADMCFEKCREYLAYIDIETYLNTKNKMVVCMEDLFQYEHSFEIADGNMDYQKEVQALRQLILDDDETTSNNLGKAYSQMGQAASFINDRSAIHHFKKALEQFEYDSPDYYITLSYLLHYYISSNQKLEYDTWSKVYFGNYDGLKEQLQYILDEGRKGRLAKISLKFALYVFIKGIYTFHIEKIGKILNKLLDIENVILSQIPDGRNYVTGHPWELIYKYIAIIAAKNGRKKRANEIAEKISSVGTDGSYALNIISNFSKAKAYFMIGENEKYDLILQELWKYDINHCKNSKEEFFEYLDDTLAYMHR